MEFQNWCKFLKVHIEIIIFLLIERYVQLSKLIVLFKKIYEILILACENGTYGYDCNKTCGHCTDKESCFHTNGTCRFGCNPGYMGELCKKGMFF